jgi:hypothetical protein
MVENPLHVNLPSAYKQQKYVQNAIQKLFNDITLHVTSKDKTLIPVLYGVTGTSKVFNLQAKKIY